MRLLLDTHILIWAVLDDPSLSAKHRDLLTSSGAEIYVSAVSVWEIAIKRALGKLLVPMDIFDQARAAGCQPLSVSWEHARAVEALPSHHGDPFDRMLIAQAKLEELTLVTADRQLAAYDVDLL